MPVKKDKKDMKMLRRMTLRKLRPMDSDFDEEEEDDKDKEKKDHDLKKKRGNYIWFTCEYKQTKNK